jgi:hypothetical protein
MSITLKRKELRARSRSIVRLQGSNCHGRCNQFIGTGDRPVDAVSGQRPRSANTLPNQVRRSVAYQGESPLVAEAREGPCVGHPIVRRAKID